MSENQAVTFSSVSALKTHLEGLTDETVSRQFIIDAINSIATRPATSGQRRGQLAGLSLSEMNEEQLKREKINADSVLYKAKQRGASDETIAKNQARADAVKAALDALKPEAPVTATSEAAGETSEEHPVAAEL